MRIIGSMSAGAPNKWTAMMAAVRGVIAASMRAGSMLKECASGSTGTGAAPSWETASHVAM